MTKNKSGGSRAKIEGYLGEIEPQKAKSLKKINVEIIEKRLEIYHILTKKINGKNIVPNIGKFRKKMNEYRILSELKKICEEMSGTEPSQYTVLNKSLQTPLNETSLYAVPNISSQNPGGAELYATVSAPVVAGALAHVDDNYNLVAPTTSAPHNSSA
jgi:hypothetical protein